MVKHMQLYDLHSLAVVCAHKHNCVNIYPEKFHLDHGAIAWTQCRLLWL